MTTQTTNLTDSDFWTVVAEIGWGTKTIDFNAVKVKLIRRGQDFCVALSNKFSDVATALYWAAKKAGHDYCCDSWSDTVNHVIGLGKEEFDRNMANPELLLTRMNEYNYKESFSYCLPYKDDFQRYSAEGIEERRQDYLTRYEAAKGRFSMVDDDVDALLGLLGSDDWQDHGDSLKGMSASIANYVREATAGWGCVDGSDVLMNKWCIWNLLSDAEMARQCAA